MAKIEGVLIWVDNKAIRDSFVGKDLVHTLVRTESGDKLCKVIPSNGFIPPDFEAYWNDAKLYIDLDAEAKTVKHQVYSSDPLFALNPEIQYTLDQVRIRASLGDTVSISWNYEICKAKIVKFSDRNNRMEWSYPVASSGFSVQEEIAAYFYRNED